MNGLDQHDPALLSVIQSIGCEYLAFLVACGAARGRDVSAEEANEAWLGGIDLGYVSDTLGLHKSYSYRSVSSWLLDGIDGSRGYLDQVGKIDLGEVTMWEKGALPLFDFAIERLVSAMGNKHSRLLNFSLDVVYDSAWSFPYHHTAGIFLYRGFNLSSTSKWYLRTMT